MQQYINIIDDILTNGVTATDRTGTGTISKFGAMAQYDLQDGFPLLTLKKTHWKSIVHELIWLLSGKTNIKYLNENGVTIWNEWADENGDLGRVYGSQWRAWFGFGFTLDQIEELIKGLIENPFGRRHIVTAWNPAELDKMALPPCHMMFQCNVQDIGGERYLNLCMYQRSADMFLGVPFNIASYSLLLMILANITGYRAQTFTHMIGDAHIYNNHISQCRKMICRESKPLPEVKLTRKLSGVDDLKYEDFELIGYDPHPAIKGAVSV